MITKLQVKYIQSLGQKKFRDEEAVFVAEGPKIINELLGGGSMIPVTLYGTGEWVQKNIEKEKTNVSLQVIEVKDAELERLSFLQTPNEVIGIFKKPSYKKPAFSGTLSLMLDGIQDPGNLGTIIRIADWFGISNIVCSNDCADAFAPKVVQASMGSIARVKLFYTDLVEMVKNASPLQLYAATLDGEPIGNLQPLKEGVLVTGNESKGISPALLNCCQHRITIPRFGQAESLNAAVATGIILSQMVRGNYNY
jgi:TrmH family RNA methyltransferase